MSFLTQTDINKRTDNLFVAFAGTAVAATAELELRSTNGAMSFLASYQAFSPATTGITGVWDAANTGANGALSAGNTVVSFTGEGSSISTVTVDANNDFVCWEIAVNQNSASSAIGGFVGFPGVTVDYFANEYVGNPSMTPPQNGYEIVIAGAPPIVVFGFVVDSGAITSFIDGVQGPTVPLNFPAQVRPLASFLP